MPWQPRASLRVIHERARVYRQIRAFFNNRGCLEVDTPLLLPTTNTDVNIDSVELRLGGKTFYLQTSPEFAMKRLLAADTGSIFQICHAFRGGESGRLHHREFALLEWYRVGYDYRQLMDEIELLITTLSLRQCEFKRISYRDLFLDELDIDIDRIELDALRRFSAQRVSGTDSSSFDADQCLDLLLGMVIAPTIRGYLFVYDYPRSQAALARISDADERVAERFELFHDGIELANGFSELTDAIEQRARFQRDNERRLAEGQMAYPMDENLLAALSSGMAACAGVAIGLDRLLMVLLGLEKIDDVLTFID